jgi:hypothetical protein
MFAVTGMAGPVAGVIVPDHWELVIEGINLAEKLPVSPPSQLPLDVKVPFIVSPTNVAVIVVVLLLLRISVIERLSPLIVPVIEAKVEQMSPKVLSSTTLELMFAPVWTMNMSTLVGTRAV